ncbi:MAG TPA: hypothetical protein VGI74_04310 [Streptosporangiaceae bacterium]|jgi:hypothetical protein
MTIEDFAGELGLAPRTVAYWRQRPETTQRPEGQRILDTALERAPDDVKARFGVLLDQNYDTAVVPTSTGKSLISDTTGVGPALPVPSPINFSAVSVTAAKDVLAWVESTNTGDDLIHYFAKAIVRAAEEHASSPPTALLAKVQQLHAMIQAVLRTRKQRHRQTTELLRLDADLLAHLCQLLGDVHRDGVATAYAEASIGLADEGGSSSAAAFSAQSQIARWRGRYAEAADFAARGLEGNPSPALRTLLSYQEADAAAASGHMARRARIALERADAMDETATAYSAWSCPPARRTLFRMGVALNLGHPHEVLQQAAEAKPMWQHEKPQAFGTWAHFQILVAKAHIMAGYTDSAMEEVVPVLDLPHEYRISTLSGHFATLDVLLKDNKSNQVILLRELLRGFTDSTGGSPTEGDV